MDNAANLARGFGENVERMIDGADQLLKVLRNARAHDPEAFDLAKLVPANDILNGLTLQIAMTDRDGIMTASNLPLVGRVDLSDREHIKVHFNTTKDELFISKPVLGRVSNKWSIQFSRKVFDRNGAFDGVIVMSLDPYYLSRFYESLEIGKGSILLVGLRDRIIRARAPAVAWRDLPRALARLLRARGLRRIDALTVGGTRLGGARARAELKKNLLPLAARVRANVGLGEDRGARDGAQAGTARAGARSAEPRRSEALQTWGSNYGATRGDGRHLVSP
jgi:hypothetical protein